MKQIRYLVVYCRLSRM